MITFYEGLPRAGKSYSCMRDEIIPALQAGRKVFAYVEGLNNAKIADVAGITLERCEELLKPVVREDVPRIYDVVENDSLVVIDEIQNFFPTSRGQLKDGKVTQFVTEHGHRGLDIVIMGQSASDVHPIWRNRIEVKLYFLKKTALGKPNSYTCTAQRATLKGDKVSFVNVSTSHYEYDQKYFGTYKSHTDGTTNKDTKVDARGVIWNTPLFRKYLPAFAVVFVVAAVYLWNTMHGGLEKNIVKNAKAQSVDSASNHPAANNTIGITASADVPAMPDQPPDILQTLAVNNRLRFLGFWRDGTQTNGIIEIRDSGGNLVQSFTFRDLSGLGWVPMTNPDATIAILTKGAARLVVTSWSIDKREGRPSETIQRAISGKPEQPAYPSLGLFPEGNAIPERSSFSS